MPRRRNSAPPSYRLHRKSGQAIVTLADAATGRRRDVLLGPHGSAASREEYTRVLAEHEARGRRLPDAGPPPGDLSVNELVLRFWRHAEGHYRHPDGSPTGELDNLRHALRPLRRGWGSSPAAQFGPLALKALRDRLVASGLCRPVVNQRVRAVQRVFRWAVSEELVPPAVAEGLRSVPGLQRGRTAAPEPEPVGPADDRHVGAALPYLLPPVAAMVRLQRLTGMRPGEACGLRADLLDRSAPLWRYRPRRHKAAHKGKARVVVVGPRAQELLAPFLLAAGDGYLFSPRRAVESLRADRRAARKTRVQPSQRDRSKRRPKVAPGDRYTAHSYARAVARACQEAAVADLAARRPDLLPPVREAQAGLRAARSAHRRASGPDRKAALAAFNAAERGLRAAVAAAAEAGDSVRHWHPNQLRHSRGTELRALYGLEGAQVGLGHARADVTQVYAETSLALAERIAREVG
jgi:integrase